MDVWAADERAAATAIQILEDAARKAKAGDEDDEDDDRQMSG